MCGVESVQPSDVISLVILGSTGSIGTQALNVVRAHPAKFRVVGLAAGGGNLALLADQVAEFGPAAVAIGRGDTDQLAAAIAAASAGEKQASRGHTRRSDPDTRAGAAPTPELTVGQDAVAALAGSFSGATVLNGITGGVGLTATLAALQAGSTLALANKESLVVGGRLVCQATVRPGQVIPVDSEHSAIAQALLSGVHEKGLVSPVLSGRSELAQIILTASGGPFRGKSRAQLAGVTAAQALDHPTWSMGPVVTVNSSTLMNKGLELIEAALLFDVPPEQIQPVVHPQSIVHSGVTWRDGSTLLQAAPPNMEVPIALGLDWPRHLPGVGQQLDWDQALSLDFEPVDNATFPSLGLARDALQASATHPAVLNAANEVAVDAFLRGELDWLGIADTVAEVLSRHAGNNAPDLADVLGAQAWAADQARSLVAAGR